MPDQPSLIIDKAHSWQMFNEISGRYDFLNRVLSLGMDLAWRRQLAAHLPKQSRIRLLDLASGTADVAIMLNELSPEIVSTVGVDMAESMLAVGRKKIAKRNLQDRIHLQCGDAQDLPFPDGTFEAVTIAFGIRNIPQLNKALIEMNRVLVPGGRALILEFSMPANPVIRAGHVFYLRTVVPVLGWLLTGHYKAYKYLNQTIEGFPYGDRFLKILKQTGFKRVYQQPLLFGAATIYVGEA